jgi:hypothetical protein
MRVVIINGEAGGPVYRSVRTKLILSKIRILKSISRPKACGFPNFQIRNKNSINRILVALRVLQL